MKTRTLDFYNVYLGVDRSLALLSIKSDIVNSIRWHKTKHPLPFLILRRQSQVHDPGRNPMIKECPIYRLDGTLITSVLEYNIVQCARGLFRDIENIILKMKRPRFGMFNDLRYSASEHVNDYIDGGLFMTYSISDKWNEVRIVECQILIAGE